MYKDYKIPCTLSVDVEALWYHYKEEEGEEPGPPTKDELDDFVFGEMQHLLAEGVYEDCNGGVANTLSDAGVTLVICLESPEEID